MPKQDKDVPVKRMSLGLYDEDIQDIEFISKFSRIKHETDVVRQSIAYYARRLRLADNPMQVGEDVQ